MRTVILGGRGNFGARICRALLDDPRFELFRAGRSDVPADDARIGSVRLDIHAADFPQTLARLSPQLVIHCAGPFQGQDHRVAQAAIDAGAHYIDLADGRHFVTTFAQRLDAAARARDVLAISGASSVPALTSAVVDRLSTRLAHIDSISTVIAPAQRALRGAATLAAVFSYAGRPFRVLRDGEWIEEYGWQDLRRVALPGLRSRLSAPCDIPDLELFPARYPGVRTVEFRAALELGIQHRALALSASLRRAGLPLPLERFAGPLDRLANRLDHFGTELGGMQVCVQGRDTTGLRRETIWHIRADHNHGPEIPCMALLLLARKLADGRISARGAYPCMGFLDLDEFAGEFARWDMHTGIEESGLP